MKKIVIEVQHFHGCPNGPQFIANVKSALHDLAEFTEYRETLVESLELSRSIGFRGSPTLLIDGNDYEDIPAPHYPGLNCRLYPNGLPTPKAIKLRIMSTLQQNKIIP